MASLQRQICLVGSIGTLVSCLNDILISGYSCNRVLILDDTLTVTMLFMYFLLFTINLHFI